MGSWNVKEINVGDELPELTMIPITRSTLALYAEASGDHNPIHIDLDFAKQVGLPDVIAHGMLVMSYLGKAITDHIDQSRIKEYGVKFSSITNLGDQLTSYGSVTQVNQTDAGKLLSIELRVSDQNNDEKLTGYSNIVLPWT